MIKHVCAYNACANACRYTCMCTFIYVFQSARIFCMVKKRAEIIRIASALHEPSPESLQVEVVWNTALKAQWSAGMKWHGLPLYLYQAASRCQDHITEFFIIIHHISYIIIIFQKRHTKKTMQTQDQTQELHRRCVTSFSQEQGVQGKGNKLPIPLSSGRWHNSAHSAASRASKHWLGAWQSQCEKLIIRNRLWFMSLMSLQ